MSDKKPQSQGASSNKAAWPRPAGAKAEAMPTSSKKEEKKGAWPPVRPAATPERPEQKEAKEGVDKQKKKPEPPAGPKFKSGTGPKLNPKVPSGSWPQVQRAEEKEEPPVASVKKGEQGADSAWPKVRQSAPENPPKPKIQKNQPPAPKFKTSPPPSPAAPAKSVSPVPPAAPVAKPARPTGATEPTGTAAPKEAKKEAKKEPARKPAEKPTVTAVRPEQKKPEPKKEAKKAAPKATPAKPAKEPKSTKRTPPATPSVASWLQRPASAPQKKQFGRGGGYVARAVELTKQYGEGDTSVVALDQVSVGFRRGEFTAIMGPSGSGKSTLMHCMAGLDSATAGQAFIGDTNLSDLEDKEMTDLRRDRLGFIFQSFNLVPTLTAAENITLPIDIAGGEVDEAWFKEITQRLGLTERLEHRPSELSGGQQQRVACARALVANPEIIFGDEPTGNLDSLSSTEVLNILRASVDKDNQTVVIVTHDARAASYADRVIFLADGKIVNELSEPTMDQVLSTMAGIERG